ncbi:helix-turn-helix domain-containing protein [Streptomyces sp. DSM 110735]|uniref:helix-turn-helix domain-containing protein n=1 Tax=Streptomyces sp. DSM 110735 TaxID=2775031 RepID=UPI0018F2C2E5|nr:helix-turn-helix transcriptional regulator [Streptomyces sp. DSM 110735]MBJ7902178.1 helix-turn-helix domain-containing protein [Streptomyces sp. DSM 110735]
MAAWELGTVVKLFRKHTGLSQAGVARMVSIDQAEVSRLERGLKQIRDRRQFVQWTDALGVPEELLGLLPTADPHSPDSTGRPGMAATRAHGYAALPEGPGQLLLPAGRSVSTTALPALSLPAASFLGDSLLLDSRPELSAWRAMPMRALIVANRTVDGAMRQFVIDARPASPGGTASDPVDIPAAYELDDLTYGILWAMSGFEAALLGDDQALYTSLASLTVLPGTPVASDHGLTEVSRMLIGSETAARYILGHRDHLGDEPVFWTREQRGEEAATWLFFKHKYRYLERMAPRHPDGASGRGFCVPDAAVAASPAYERVLLFLAIALMESFGIRTWVTDDSGFAHTDGFALSRGRRAVIASWVRTKGASHLAVTARPGVLRTFADVTGHVSHHSATAAEQTGQRLAATAEYLGLDAYWLGRRCAQLSAVGTERLARPRSRLLGLEGLEAACQFVSEQLVILPRTRTAPTR